mmetsp:Transcript_63370/g.137942  ORF Transcript_63370/g.137942 Transcript_63370/m.137942 type:complete len:174 (-) Transcript_63370:58-579(-)
MISLVGFKRISGCCVCGEDEEEDESFFSVAVSKQPFQQWVLRGDSYDPNGDDLVPGEDGRLAGAAMYGAHAREPPAPLSGPRQSEEFEVVLEKYKLRPQLGIELGRYSDGGHEILSISDGIVTDYNCRAQKDGRRQVRPGHFILAVNDVSGNRAEILQACGLQPHVRMRVRTS